MPFRLSPGQMRELEAVAHSFGKTKQRFVADLVVHEIAEHKKRQFLQRTQQSQPPITPSSSSSSEQSNDSGGLGIAAVLRQKPREQSEPAPVAPPSVVVQVGNGAPTNGNAPLSDLDRLALYIVKGDDFLRDARKRTIIEVLRASANSDEELNVLVAQLEQIIAIKTKAVEENSGVNKLARFAFDKLSSLLRGD